MPISISTLFFDLDGTLYPQESGVWDAVGLRINDFIREHTGKTPAEIPAIRDTYYRQYGTTLAGLQANYSIDPYAYLDYIHDIDITKYITPDPILREMLMSLPQPKWIFTNANSSHASRVLQALGIEALFSGIIDIIALDFKNKPTPQAYHQAMAFAGETLASRCALIEDTPHNLDPAKQMGFLTGLVSAENSYAFADYTFGHIHLLTQTIPELVE